MNFWDAKWMNVMEENQISRDLEDRYMDDIRVILMALKAGWRWLEDGFYWCEEWQEEDMKSEVTQEDRTANILLESMNSVMKFLRFTKEAPNDFEDKKLPTLDIKIWIEKMQIWYMFYQKPMCNNIVVQEKSALSESVKVSSLTEEIVRRLKNTRDSLPVEYRMETLEDISQRMRNSGHSNPFMKRILMAGITKYEKKLRNSRLDNRSGQYKPLHQPSGRSINKLKQKTLARENWFKGSDKQDETGVKKVQQAGKQKNSNKQKKEHHCKYCYVCPKH